MKVIRETTKENLKFEEQYDLCDKICEIIEEEILKEVVLPPVVPIQGRAGISMPQTQVGGQRIPGTQAKAKKSKHQRPLNCADLNLPAKDIKKSNLQDITGELL